LLAKIARAGVLVLDGWAIAPITDRRLALSGVVG
jgi:hypothetical protein